MISLYNQDWINTIEQEAITINVQADYPYIAVMQKGQQILSVGISRSSPDHAISVCRQRHNWKQLKKRLILRQFSLN